MFQVKTKILSLLICSAILTIPVHTLAQQGGKITNLDEGTPAPFSGILLDTTASARLLTEKEYQNEECNIKLSYEFEKIKARHNLEMGIIKSKVVLLEETSTSILSMKDIQIKRLQELTLKNPNDNANWWFTGGVVAGVITSLVIFYAAVEIPKE
tara:strand:+ start:1194 stop:1658 length:465 start_codon:yes stop_codon:yes gene_type:complete